MPINSTSISAITLVVCVLLVLVRSDSVDDLDIFGVGAEDADTNFLDDPLFPDESSSVGADANAFKSTRQDQEDVEWFLNPGPMIAPDIIMKRFVDSRVFLADENELFKPMDKVRVAGNNSVVMDMEAIESDSDMMASDDLLDTFGPELNDIVLKNESPGDSYKLRSTVRSCDRRFLGSAGAFNLSFEEDCLIQIEAPTEDSRLFFTCSPVPLGDCSIYRDSLAVNLLGDISFKQNSFLFCGKDARIQVISLQKKLAIRVKRMEDPVSTFCTFHSRQRRQYGLQSSVACGKLGRSAKIIGGRRVPPGLFPWAAQLDITRTDGSQTGCTGSVVSPHYILTAAHCMKRAESVSAFVGGTDRTDLLGSELLIQAEKFILHRKWSSRTLVADIALVKLTHPIQYADDIAPICLPEGKMITEDFSGRRGVALGWGRTETKKKAPRRLYRIKLPLMTDTTCRNIYRKFFIPKMMVCTDSKKDAAICYGKT